MEPSPPIATKSIRTYRRRVERRLVCAQRGEVRRHPLGIGRAVHGQRRHHRHAGGQPLAEEFVLTGTDRLLRERIEQETAGVAAPLRRRRTPGGWRGRRDRHARWGW